MSHVASLADFPALAGLSPDERIRFALVNYCHDPELRDYLIAQGMNSDAVDALIELAQSWDSAGKRGFTAEELARAKVVIDGPPIVLDTRAGLSDGTRAYLKTLKPGQSVDLAHVRALAAARQKVIRIHRTPRQSHRSRQTVHAARAICGGSDDSDGGGDGAGGPAPVDPASVNGRPSRATQGHPLRASAVR
jgi:hypothetical protein